MIHKIAAGVILCIVGSSISVLDIVSLCVPLRSVVTITISATIIPLQCWDQAAVLKPDRVSLGAMATPRHGHGSLLAPLLSPVAATEQLGPGRHCSLGW